MESKRKPNAPILTHNLAENWGKFKQKYNLYFLSTSFENKRDELKITLLLYVTKSSAIEL